MASGNLRIFGGSPRPFSQVGTDERKNPRHGLYRPNFPCRTIFRPGLIRLAKAPGWSGAGLAAGFESAGSLPRESAATPFWHFWHLPEPATLPRTPAIGAECSGSATGGLRFAAGSALRERQPHREGRRAAPNHPDHGRAPGRPEVIAADEVAAEGLAHARTLKMTSVDQTEVRIVARFGPDDCVVCRGGNRARSSGVRPGIGATRGRRYGSMVVSRTPRAG